MFTWVKMPPYDPEEPVHIPSVWCYDVTPYEGEALSHALISNCSKCKRINITNADGICADCANKQEEIT